MIRKATIGDMEEILVIIRKAVVLMQRSGNDQWNSSYPSYEDFHKDISAGELFVHTAGNGEVQSVICLNHFEPDEYAGVQWKYSKPALVIHRMAVAPRFHGKGLAKKLFSFAEERARELNLNYLRSDTCSRNAGMNNLFKRSGYRFSGTIRFPGFQYDYNCYEKYLDTQRSGR